jgi:hypothetical protein
MNKILYIIGLVCVPILFFSFIQFENLDRDARYDSYGWNDYDYDSGDSYGDYSYGDSYTDSYDERSNISMNAGIVGLFITLYFAAVYIIGIMKVKRTVALVFNIIGICVAGIYVLVNIIPVLNPGDAYFDDYGPSWIFEGMLMIPCCIIGLVQSIKYGKELKYGKDYYRKPVYVPQAPSYNPNHPSAAAVIPGQPHYQGQQPTYQPPAPPPPQAPPAPQPLRPQAPGAPAQPTPITQQPPAPQVPPAQAPAAAPQLDILPVEPQAPASPPEPPAQGGVAPIPPAPTVNPAPPVMPPNNDPIITDDDGIDKIDDL